MLVLVPFTQECMISWQASAVGYQAVNLVLTAMLVACFSLPAYLACSHRGGDKRARWRKAVLAEAAKESAAVVPAEVGGQDKKARI